MDEKAILEELYDRSMDKIFATSANYAFTVPKKGFEAEFRKEKEIAEYLQKKISNL